MYLSLVKNIYSHIHAPRYESYSEFEADMDSTLETFYTTLEEVDPDLAEHLTSQVLTSEAHDADEYQQKKFQELAEDILDGSNRNYYHPMD